MYSGPYSYLRRSRTAFIARLGGRGLVLLTSRGDKSDDDS